MPVKIPQVGLGAEHTRGQGRGRQQMGREWGSPQPSGLTCALSGRREAKPSSLQTVRVGETRARAGVFREGQRGDMSAKTWGGQERAVGIEGKKHLASLSTGASEPEESQQVGSPRQVSSERAQHQIPARGFWGQAGRGGALGGDPRGQQ